MLVGEEGAVRFEEFEKAVVKLPPKKRDFPSRDDAIEATGPFRPAKGRGAHVEVFVDQAATCPA